MPRQRESTASPEPVGTWTIEELRSEHFPSAGGETAYLVDVRAAGHEGLDRVVLEFDGSDVPSYRVAYVSPPILRDGSGALVPVAGEAYLELRLTPASCLDVTGEDLRWTYDGPDRVTAVDGQVVSEVVKTADFEATLAWTVGLPRPLPFAAQFLQSPLRLVVDILHGRQSPGPPVT